MARKTSYCYPVGCRKTPRNLPLKMVDVFSRFSTIPKTFQNCLTHHSTCGRIMQIRGPVLKSIRGIQTSFHLYLIALSNSHKFINGRGLDHCMRVVFFPPDTKARGLGLIPNSWIRMTHSPTV